MTSFERANLRAPRADVGASRGMAAKSASCHVLESVKISSPRPSIRYPDPSTSSERDLAAFLAEVPPGAVVELAPGRYRGPISVDRPLTIKGAGDLTRLEGEGEGPVVRVDVDEAGLVYFESLTIASGRAERGAGLAITSGRVRLFNVQVRDCEASDAGGGIWAGGGEVEARLLRMTGLAADRGGAVAVQGHARFAIFDGELRDAWARVGGAIHASESSRIRLSGTTFGRTRATSTSGGQVLWIGAARSSELVVELERVRFEDVPIGRPLVVEAERPGKVVLFECDVPTDVFENPGIVDGGNNTWR